MCLGKLHSLEGLNKTALNLTDGEEVNRTKIISHVPIYGLNGTEIISEIPIYAREHRWRVWFCVEKENRQISRGTLSFTLDDVASELKGIAQLRIIARDLQRAYDLPYTPSVYQNCRLVTPQENAA